MILVDPSPRRAFAEEEPIPSVCVGDGVTVDSRDAARFFGVPHAEIVYRCLALGASDCLPDREDGDAFYRMGRVGFSRVVEGLPRAGTYLEAFDSVILESPCQTEKLLGALLAADRARHG